MFGGVDKSRPSGIGQIVPSGNTRSRKTRTVGAVGSGGMSERRFGGGTEVDNSAADRMPFYPDLHKGLPSKVGFSSVGVWVLPSGGGACEFLCSGLEIQAILSTYQATRRSRAPAIPSTRSGSTRRSTSSSLRLRKESLTRVIGFSVAGMWS